LPSDRAPNQVYSVLEAFRPFLKSIDARTIAVRVQADGEWENLVTSVFVSELSVAEVEKEHSGLPKVNNDQIKLVLFALPFDYSLFNRFLHGDIPLKWITSPAGEWISFGKSHIKTRQFDPLDIKMVSALMRLSGVLKWVLTATNSNNSPERAQLWATISDQTIEAKRLNYSEMYELIKDVLRKDNVPQNIDFELIISDLAKIKDVTLSTSSVEVEIEKVGGLKDLQLNVQIERETDGGFSKTVLRNVFPIDENGEEHIGKICLLKKTVQTPLLLPYDNIELELIHRNSALTLDRTRMNAPLKNVVEPFFKTLDAFCSTDMFKEMLLKPENFKKAPELIFENAVAWLLSLAGFHTVYLGANAKTTKMHFDVLRKEGGYQIGSADIIAYKDNERLLLVDCDIGGLNETKIQKLIETRDYFKALSNYGKLEFVPVLFTPKRFEWSMKIKPVTVVDGNVIEGILEDLAKGNRKSACSKF
jgi:hypothetical protein